MKTRAFENGSIYFAICAAVSIGVAQMLLLQYFLSFSFFLRPFWRWVHASEIIDPWLTVISISLNLFINLIICLPGAYLICKLRPQKLWLYVLLAVVPEFFWTTRLVFTSYPIIENLRFLVPGIYFFLTTLPFAVLVVYFVCFKQRLTTQSRGTSVWTLDSSYHPARRSLILVVRSHDWSVQTHWLLSHEVGRSGIVSYSTKPILQFLRKECICVPQRQGNRDCFRIGSLRSTFWQKRSCW